MDQAPSIVSVDRLDLRFEPKPWAFAVERRAEIDAYFAVLQREKPALWNGRVLVLHKRTLADGVFRGAFLETDYASFVAWIAWGHPSVDVYDCFGAGAILAADGGFLLGVMGAHTHNAGQIYFPCGTPDPSDIVGGKVDLDFSVCRELAEETGVVVAELDAEPGWTIAIDGALMCAIKVFRAKETADELRDRVLARLAREAQPELTDIRIVRNPGDFHPKMRRFVKAFLEHRWRER
jgi:8-oxo-dGTP pyrophosphatase MutT (NUDIX family)